MRNESAPFRTAEDALTFAFHYATEQSPRNPMSGLMNEGAIGKGTGLYGTDGAAQAAMIQSVLSELPDAQRWVLTVRFADNPSICKCCGGEKMPDVWQIAVNNLIQSDELDKISIDTRRAWTAQVLNRKAGQKTNQQGTISERTLYRRFDKYQQRLNHLEKTGLAACRAIFKERGVI